MYKTWGSTLHPPEGCLVVVPHSLVVPGAQLMRKAGKLEDRG